MAVTDAKKVDYLWKKIGYGVTKTDTNAAKKAPNESIASPLLLRGDKTWNQADQIPAVMPASSEGVTTVYPTSSPDETTNDATATANRTWKTGLTDWIPPEFGSTYQVKVYIHTSGDASNAAGSGTQVFATGSGNNDEWFFDYQSGVLHFIGTNLPNGVNFSGKSVYISGARYTGTQGLQNLLSSSSSRLTFVGDDSTGFTASANDNDDVKFVGGTNITTSVTENEVTITGATDITANSIASADSSAVQVNDGLNVAGNIDVQGNTVTGLGTPSADADAATKAYVDSQVSASNTLTVGGDDSTEASIDLDSTLNVKGAQGISTSATGDTLTITGPDLTSYLQNVSEDTTPQLGGNLDLNSNNITGSGNINITGAVTTTGNVTVGGNLEVTGTTTTIDSQNLTVEDALLELSSNNSGGSDVDAGILVNRGSAGNNAAFYWNEGDDKFKAVTTTSDATATSVTDSATATVVANIEGNVTSTGTSAFETITLNNVSSSDSTAIQVNDALNVAGNIDVQGNTITGLATPSADADAATKAYVDSQVSAGNTLTVGGDDSTEASIDLDATLNVKGAQGISTSATGDTLTITGPDLTSYVQNSDTAITIVGDDSTGSAVTVGETFKIAGGDGITTAIVGDTLTITSAGGAGSNPVAKQFDYNKLGQSIATVDEFDKGEARGAFYHVSLEDKDNAIVGQYRINLVHNDTDAFISVFDLLEDSTNMVTFSADISGNNIRLRAVASSTEHINLRFNKFILHDGLETTTSTNTKVTVTSSVPGDSSFTTVDSFETGELEAAKYFALVKETSNDYYEVVEIGLTHDGTNVSSSAYARVNTNNTQLAIFASSIVNGEVRLRSASKSSNDLSVTLYRIGLGSKTKYGLFDGITYGRVTDIDSSEVVIDEFDSYKQSGAKYIVSANQGSEYQLFEVSVTGDSDTSNIVTTSITDGSNEIVTFATDVSDGKVRLKATGSGFNNSLYFGRVDYAKPNSVYTVDADDQVYINSKTGLHVPKGTTAQRPTASKGLLRFNVTTGKYEVSEDGSNFVNLRTSGAAATISKDVFTGDGSTTAFTMTSTPADENNIVVYIDGVMQEPDESYTISGTTLTITEAVHSNGRVVVMHGFAD